MAGIQRTPEIQGLTVVLAGSFNPKLFDPWWFAKQGLLQEEEAKNAEVTVMTSTLSTFSIGWLRLHAEAERVQVTTTQPQYYDPLRDLLLGTFKILRHTPVTAMGLHWMAHYRSENEEEWHKIGNTLAPKKIWDKILTKPGLRTMVIEELRKKEPTDYTRVAVEPSLKVQPGVFFEVHDHYDSPPQDPPVSAEQVMSLLQLSWQSSLTRSQEIMTHILMETLR
jgi:hypothetical protein